MSKEAAELAKQRKKTAQIAKDNTELAKKVKTMLFAVGAVVAVYAIYTYGVKK